MPITALVLSAAAIVIAGLSLRYARRQAHLNAAEDRRKRTPVLEGGFVTEDPHRQKYVWLELKSLEPLTGLTVELSPNVAGLSFGLNRQGTPRSSRAEWDKPLTMGGRAMRPLTYTERWHGTAQLRVTCRAGKDLWIVPVTVKPPDPPKFVGR